LFFERITGSHWNTNCLPAIKIVIRANTCSPFSCSLAHWIWRQCGHSEPSYQVPDCSLAECRRPAFILLPPWKRSYKPESRRFDIRCDQWMFSIYLILTQPLTEINTRNRKKFLRSTADCLDNVESLTSHNPMGLHGLLQQNTYLYFTSVRASNSQRCKVDFHVYLDK
jgi:hypothetical protein